MKVRHHPHVHSDSHRKKRFKEYFFDFLIVFIGVTLGFFSEGLRESIGNKHKETAYLRSLVEDIKKDTAGVDYVVRKISERNKGIDTFLNLLTNPSTATNSNRLFKLRKNLGFPDFIYTDRTIQQLKNTGQLRLIRSLETSNLMTTYDAHARNALILDNILNNIIDGVISNTNKILDFSQVKGWAQGLDYDSLEIPNKAIPLLVHTRVTLIEYYNNISDYKRFALGFSTELIKLKDEGIKLIDYLHKKYYIKD